MPNQSDKCNYYHKRFEIEFSIHLQTEILFVDPIERSSRTPRCHIAGMFERLAEAVVREAPPSRTVLRLIIDEFPSGKQVFEIEEFSNWNFRTGNFEEIFELFEYISLKLTLFYRYFDKHKSLYIRMSK